MPENINGITEQRTVPIPERWTCNRTDNLPDASKVGLTDARDLDSILSTIGNVSPPSEVAIMIENPSSLSGSESEVHMTTTVDSASLWERSKVSRDAKSPVAENRKGCKSSLGERTSRRLDLFRMSEA